MPLTAPPRRSRPTEVLHTSLAVPATVLLLAAAGVGAVVAAAPDTARTWTGATAGAGWLCLAVALVVHHLLLKRARRATAAKGAEVERLTALSGQQLAESAHLVNVTVPALVTRLRDGAPADDTLAKVAQPSDAQLRQVVQVFASAMEQAAQRAAALDAERLRAQQALAGVHEEIEWLTREVLPAAVAELQDGGSADTVLARWGLASSSPLREPVDAFIRELAVSERRAAVARAASAKALSRVQAKTVSMLADLREMQERHGEEVFGDLLNLDHSTSQLGLMTDRLALLMGGRSSRAWNKPIVMESILRGAAGRIAAYHRVRLHCSTKAAISGFAAEGIMHLLAELMDNAANFSPPIDEVHVYVDEHSAGIVVTIEDSGLKMAGAAMRRAEEAVSGKRTDLAELQGTRLGLAVVGGLSVRYGVSVNYRPSSRGGTGVVVLLPPQLLAQRREPGPAETAPRRTAAPVVPGPAEPVQEAHSAMDETVTGSAVRPAPEQPAGTGPDVRPAAGRPEDPARSAAAEGPGLDAPRRHRPATPNGLPVRAPGRTMADADRDRAQRQAPDGPAGSRGEPGPAPSPTRNAGARFGAFHSGRKSAEGTDTSGTGIDLPDLSGSDSEPPAP